MVLGYIVVRSEPDSGLYAEASQEAYRHTRLASDTGNGLLRKYTPCYRGGSHRDFRRLAHHDHWRPPLRTKFRVRAWSSAFFVLYTFQLGPGRQLERRTVEACWAGAKISFLSAEAPWADPCRAVLPSGPTVSSRGAANRTASFILILQLAARGRQEVDKGVLTLSIFRSKPRAESYGCTTGFKIE